MNEVRIATPGTRSRIRSTFIAGVPGETEAEFEELLQFLREAELDRVGCFAYSPVEGAAANALPGMLPEDVREERRARFMQVQQEISRARLARKVGTVQRVLLDEVGPTVAMGRTAADAPEIDGVVYVKKGRRKLDVGTFVDVSIASADEHDLHGTLA
jgi:ribosomal protein S12 methylthiotransferase